MDADIILNEVQGYVKDQLSGDSSGHDYWHIERVVNNAKKLLNSEKADGFKVLIAAWLHDVGDYKLHNGKDKTQEIVFPLLISLGCTTKFAEEIIQIIEEVSFKGGHNSPTTSIEAKIVQDADRLDAIGAIGIARAFAYGGSKGRVIFNPDEKPEEYLSSEAYQKNNSSTLMHFYEKLLKLKDLMNTDSAKEIAHERHRFMVIFLDQFQNEVSH
ncbi:HD domain-containing protein [Apibacter raozihei]|uniref:HD domain-containing protein n=1 Tax=Apibacter raozihei TaxID=2500547 RepID=UPI000FE418AE|nr:HD domain-containing protein [Apibacter raozihei]